MRSIFILAEEQRDGELEILYSFGMTRPPRATIKRVAKEYPTATHFASMTDSEEKHRIRRIYSLRDMNRWEQSED